MRAVTGWILLVVVLAAPACDDRGGSAPPAEDAAPDFGPTAAYNRRLLFLGPGGDQPAMAVFDFTTLSDSIGIRRGARARVGEGERWRALMDAGWEMEPMREPWRLVPHGPLTMVVGETGDLGTLIFRDSLTVRLELGPTLAEHSPDVGTQLVLRTARLQQGDEAVAGIVLDAQLGRAVNPTLVARDRPARPGADTLADDTTAPSPTPIARPGAEALLLDDQGYYAVLTTATSGSLAWIRSGDRGDVRTGTRLEPLAWSTAEEGVVQVPMAWRVISVDGELNGELSARATDRVVLRDDGGVEALAYVLVTGWIEDRAARRDVYGLVRHVR